MVYNSRKCWPRAAISVHATWLRVPAYAGPRKFANSSEGEKLGERTWKSHVHLSVLQSRYWPVKHRAAQTGAHIRIWSPLVEVRRARAGGQLSTTAAASPPSREAIEYLLAVRHL